MSQNLGINLIFKEEELTETQVFEAMLAFYPHGPLYEGFRIPGKNKYIDLWSDAKAQYHKYSLWLNTVKNLNYMEADEDGLEIWEDICSLDKKHFTITRRRINIAIHIGDTKRLTTIQQLAFFILNTLGIFYIKWRYASGELTDANMGYNYRFDMTADYGGYGRRQGIIWTLNKSLVQNNKDLKYFLDKISIQTQVNFYEDESGKPLLITD